LRAGIVQGLGAALLEHCHYDDNRQLLASSLMDYAPSRSDSMHAIDVGQGSTLQCETAIGVKGVGEAGITGADATVSCAI